MYGISVGDTSVFILADVFETATKVSTPLALLAFAIAAWLVWQITRTRQETKRLELLPDDERAQQVDEFLTRFGIDGGNLTREQKFKLIREEMRKRFALRLYSSVAVLIAFVVCFAIAAISFGSIVLIFSNYNSVNKWKISMILTVIDVNFFLL